jgi:hypothetical protein
MVGATVETLSISHASVRSSALQHFTIFLQQTGVDEVKRLCRNQPDVFVNGEELTFENLNFQKVTIKLLDEFACYLYKTATHLPTSNTPTAAVSMNSGSTMFSQVKGAMIDVLTNNGFQNFELNNREAWSKLRAALLKGFHKVAEAVNKPVKNPHKTASDEDITSIGATAISTEDPEMAVFYAFVVASINFFGRGTEVARAEFHTLRTESPPEFDNSEEMIAVLALWRRKTQKHQHLSIFGNRDSPIKDLYFALGYMMIMNDETRPGSAIFPSFYARAGADIELQSEGKRKRSQVSAHWETNFGKLLEEFKQTVAGAEQRGETITTSREFGKNMTLNEELTSHSQKRHAMNVANGSPRIKFTWLCVRAGYSMDSAHTAFEYFDENVKQTDRQSGRGISNWLTFDGDGLLGGGRPPMLKSLGQTDDAHRLAALLGENLFVKYEEVDGANDVNLQNMILATVLKDLVWLVSLLLGHPLRKFGTTVSEVWKKHRFLQKVSASAHNVGIANPEETLMKWSVTIQEDWVRRNYAYVPLDRLITAFGDNDLLVDPRSLMTIIQNIQILVSGLQEKFNHQTNEVVGLKNAVVIMENKLHEQVQTINQLKEQGSELMAQNRTLIGQGQRTNVLLEHLLKQSNGGAGADLSPVDMLVLNPIPPAVSRSTITPSRANARSRSIPEESLFARPPVIVLPSYHKLGEK